MKLHNVIHTNKENSHYEKQEMKTNSFFIDKYQFHRNH
jgi:hypothetical protein